MQPESSRRSNSSREQSLAGLLGGTAKEVPDRIVVVQFSRMNDPFPKKGDAAVMWKKWRLVSDKELYDISEDPGQKKNLIDQAPQVVEKMRAHYEKWWGEVSPTLGSFSRSISVRTRRTR